MTRKEQFKRRRQLTPLLRAWYGRESGSLEMVAHTPEPVEAGELMRELFEELIDRDVAHFITLESRWGEIVPGKVGSFTRPVRFREKILYLEVRHSALIRELAPSLDLFLKRVAEVIGDGECTAIKLIPAGSLTR